MEVKGSIRGEVDSYTKLLIHSDTTDNSTDFVDSGSTGHTITANNDASHQNTQKKFGDTSIYFDGTDDFLTVDANSDWDFNDGDFTIDFWMRSLTTHTDRQHTLDFNNPSSLWTTNISFDFNDTYGLWVYWNSGGGNYIRHGADGAYTDTNWHHISMVRYSGTVNVFVDGV